MIKLKFSRRLQWFIPVAIPVESTDPSERSAVEGTRLFNLCSTASVELQIGPFCYDAYAMCTILFGYITIQLHLYKQMPASQNRLCLRDNHNRLRIVNNHSWALHFIAYVQPVQHKHRRIHTTYLVKVRRIM